MEVIFIAHFIFVLFLSSIFCLFGLKIFYPIFTSSTIIIEYGLHPFDICIEQPLIWKYIKILFVISYIFSSIILSNSFFSLFIRPFIKTFSKKIKHPKHISSVNSNELSLFIGKNIFTDEKIFLPEKSLYQNILVTGTIGTGKTSSAMYPFTQQLIKYKSNNFEKKIGMLILDVKGNYYKQVKKFCKIYNREEDLIIIELNGNYKYNPLHKPNLKPSVLANRLKTILLLFSKNNTESFWLDKAEQVLAEAIKLCRLYNDGYVTFDELHKIIMVNDYYLDKLKILREKFNNNYYNHTETYDLLSSITFFEKEFLNLDPRTLSIIKSEITRITNSFIGEYDILKNFSPPLEELNFLGFQDVLENGKIVVLNMNISEYAILSKIISAYLKLDFQSEVMMRLANNFQISNRSVAFISDEYHEYCTETDSNFFSQSREAKCINILATQSYTSLLNTINNQATVKMIIQNLINKLWFRSDDIFTIEDIQKQIGKEDKEKSSHSISENAQKTVFSYLTNSLNSKNSNISETISTSIQTDFIYDTKFFTQELENFTALGFLSDGSKIIPPQKLKLIPYFLYKEDFHENFY